MALMGGEMRQQVTDWKTDKRWSDKFLPEIKSILGQNFIGEANQEEDALHNTDLIVLKMDVIRFACRVRKYDYYERFGNEFTLRSARPGEHKTELAKVIEGWGDYFFYGFASADETALHSWIIGDLKVFRLWFNRCLAAGKTPWQMRANRDGSSDFLVFTISDLPKEFVKHSYSVQQVYSWN